MRLKHRALRISHNGPGMNHSYIRRIFSPVYMDVRTNHISHIYRRIFRTNAQ